ncbi:hypothetical protein FQA39_LY16790 [Lamprigera yunnana]|nr:hypothetical protein FQA39_LY16790 [Lamprigera yunnana]
MKPCCVPGCSDKVAKRFAIPSEKRIRDIWLQRINNDNLIYLNYRKLKHYRVYFTEPSEQNSFSYSPQQQTFVTPENIKEILKGSTRWNTEAGPSWASDSPHLTFNTTTKTYSSATKPSRALFISDNEKHEHREHKLKTSEHRESEEIDTLGIELLPTTSPPEFVTIVTKRKVSFPVGSPKRNSVLQIGGVMRQKHINNILRGKVVRRANSDPLTSLAFINGFVEVGEDDCCLPQQYRIYQEQINKFEVRDSDVYLLSHLKTGTTWTLEMIWLILNNLDYELARKRELINRCPNFELPVHTETDLWFPETDFMTHLNKMPNPRCIRSHLHWSLLPEQIRDGTKKPKIISVMRNAEDTCISYYHHCRLLEGYTGSFDDFYRLFLAGRTLYGPFWKQVLSVWRQRHTHNILFIKYVDMKENLKKVIEDVARFLERDLSEGDINSLAKHLSFDSMKNNAAVNLEQVIKGFAKEKNLNIEDGHFIRCGVVGSHKSKLTEEQIEQFKVWTREHIDGTGLEYENL